MKLFEISLLFLALSLPVFGQSPVQKQRDCERKDASEMIAKVAVPGDSTVSLNVTGQTIMVPTASGSSETASELEASYSRVKVLFLKKICWLPFRRATYS